MSIQVRTTRTQDGASRATPQGSGLAVAPGARRPARIGPAFANVLGQERVSKHRLGTAQAEPESAKIPAREPTSLRSRDEDLESERGERFPGDPREEDDQGAWLDPLCRSMALGLPWKAPMPLPETKPEPAVAMARVSIEQVLEQFVRKIAWSGDGRAGAARIELGAGALAGATLLVQTDGPEVRVTLELPAGADAASWRDRIGKRLAASGLKIAELEVC